MPTTTTRAKTAKKDGVVTHVVVYRREPPEPWDRALVLFLLYVVAAAAYLYL